MYVTSEDNDIKKENTAELLNIDTGERHVLITSKNFPYSAYLGVKDPFIHITIQNEAGDYLLTEAFTRHGEAMPIADERDGEDRVASADGQRAIRWMDLSGTQSVTLLVNGRKDRPLGKMYEFPAIWSDDNRYFALEYLPQQTSSLMYSTTLDVYTADGDLVRSVTIEDKDFRFTQLRWTSCD